MHCKGNLMIFIRKDHQCPWRLRTGPVSAYLLVFQHSSHTRLHSETDGISDTVRHSLLSKAACGRYFFSPLLFIAASCLFGSIIANDIGHWVSGESAHVTAVMPEAVCQRPSNSQEESQDAAVTNTSIDGLFIASPVLLPHHVTLWIVAVNIIRLLDWFIVLFPLSF